MLNNKNKATLEKNSELANRMKQQNLKKLLNEIDDTDYTSNFKESFKNQWNRHSKKQKKDVNFK